MVLYPCYYLFRKRHCGPYFIFSHISINPLKNAVEFIQNGVNGKRFDEIVSSLMNSDPYMALADFADYQKAQAEVSKAYADKKRFAKMSLMNISGAGIFSADRSIMDYANYIWHTQPVKFEAQVPDSEKKSAPMAPKTAKKSAEKKAPAKKTTKSADKKAKEAKKPEAPKKSASKKSKKSK